MFMIINESERNRIKSLYGLLTESAPPEESVLVDNKNPFKYTDLNSARRQYSPNLKDGDLFFVLKEDTTKYIAGIFKPLYVTYSNSTIRIPSKDEILKMKLKSEILFDNRVSISIKENKVACSVSFEYSIGKEKLVEPSGPQLIGYEKIKVLDKPQDFTVTCSLVGENFSTKIYKSRMLETEIAQQFPEIYNALTQIGQKMKETYKTNYVNIIDQIPNEYFEIRKIQRQITSF